MINYLTRVHFDENILEKSLREELMLAGKTRPLIVTDDGVVHAGLVDRVYNAIPKDYSFVIFDKTPTNPTEAAARAAADLYANENCDCFIALGGGSPIDLAKAAALTVTHEGQMVNYAAIYGGVRKIANCLPPLFAIPTTAGTGSEVGRGALIIVDDGRKLGFLSLSGDFHSVLRFSIRKRILTLLPFRSITSHNAFLFALWSKIFKCLHARRKLGD